MKRTAALAGLGAAVALTIPLGSASASSAAASSVTIDYAADAGPAAHVASGFLHGIDAQDPAQYLIDGVAVHSIRGADYHPNLPSLYDPDTYHRVSATGADLQVGLYYYQSMPDHPHQSYRPGDNGDFETWSQIVTDVYQEAEANDYQVGSWITWNEPDIQWNSPERPFTTYLQAHDVAHDTVKDLDPDARVQAPELSRFDFDRLTEFLSYCAENDCLPDVLSWHELTDAPTDVPGHVAQIRQWMIDNGIEPMPVTITEFQGTGYGNPNAWHVGKNVRWLAQFERAAPGGLESALYSAWEWVGDDPNFRASLGNAADRATVSLPRGVWWNYHAYKDMTGRMIEATSADPTTVDTLAAVDTGLRRAVALIGNQTSQPQDVDLRLANIPSELTRDGQVRVRVSEMPSVDALTSPPTVVDQDVQVGGNGAELTLPALPADAAYRVDILPATEQASRTLLEAEDLPATATDGVTYRTFAENGASGGQATSLDATADGQWVRYSIDVPEDGVYDLRAGLKELDTRGIAQVYLDGEALGGPIDEYGAQGYDSADVGVTDLAAGVHEVEFQVVAKHPESSGRSLVIDYLELISLSS